MRSKRSRGIQFRPAADVAYDLVQPAIDGIEALKGGEPSRQQLMNIYMVWRAHMFVALTVKGFHRPPSELESKLQWLSGIAANDVEAVTLYASDVHDMRVWVDGFRKGLAKLSPQRLAAVVNEMVTAMRDKSLTNQTRGMLAESGEAGQEEKGARVVQGQGDKMPG